MLVFEWKDVAGPPIDLTGWTPTNCAQATAAELELRSVTVGRRSVPACEWFRISGDPSDLRWSFHGDGRRTHGLAAGMTEGEVAVYGSVGRKAGAEIEGGRLEIHGDAGDFLGASMKGGAIVVSGSAGDDAGAAWIGDPKGMTGGEIRIGGHAGDRLGTRMRRGLIVVGGNTGVFTAGDLTAGSVFVLGDCGANPAVGMRRGTLAVFGRLPDPAPFFRPAACTEFTFMRVYLNHLKSQGVLISNAWFDACYTRYTGDWQDGGLGEILHLAS